MVKKQTNVMYDLAVEAHNLIDDIEVYTILHQKVLMKKLQRLDELLKKLSYEIDPEVDVSFAKTMAKLKSYEQESLRQ